MIVGILLFLLGFDSFHPDAVLRENKEAHYGAPFTFTAQRFYLIGKGSQFFAFESEDHTLVLKLFKARHYLPKFSKRLSLLLSSSLQKKSDERWKKKFLDTCACYELAFTELCEETGLIALHFSKTETPHPVTLVDGTKEYSLDLSTVPFVLQKKAILFPEYLRQLTNKEAQKQAIESLKALFAERAQKKITDGRQSLRINYGFVEGKAIQIDPGKIYRDEQLDLMIEREKLNARVDRWVLKHFRALSL
ncbi:MAG TPA: hypothetical protein VLF61_01340 [Rhabdochlamydiaceae bacterium]|nr:hypothetical protein [Rhabdochlamydiaceae bacterium]